MTKLKLKQVAKKVPTREKRKRDDRADAGGDGDDRAAKLLVRRKTRLRTAISAPAMMPLPKAMKMTAKNVLDADGGAGVVEQNEIATNK